jgi:hypothetical protein
VTRARAALALSLALAVAGGVAHAQDPALRRLKRPAPVAPTAAPDVASPPASPKGPDVATARVAPLPGADRLHVGPAVTTAPVLRSAVRSRWSTPVTIASRGDGVCRSQCASSRISCLSRGVEDGIGRCDAAWTNCLSTCADLAYGRAPPAP